MFVKQFANRHCPVAVVTKVAVQQPGALPLGQLGDLVVFKSLLAPISPKTLNAQAREDTGARRAAERVAAMGIGKNLSPRRQAIHIGCDRVRITAHEFRPIIEVINGNEKHVWRIVSTDRDREDRAQPDKEYDVAARGFHNGMFHLRNRLIASGYAIHLLWLRARATNRRRATSLCEPRGWRLSYWVFPTTQRRIHHRKKPPMKKPYALLVLSCLLLSITSAFAEPTQPNIIIYMVDDLGWNHIGVEQATLGTHGKQYVTPHLAGLAKEGLSFTHAYAQPNCAPTRAAMLSGQYPARIHNDVYVVGNLNRNGRGGISKEKAKFIGPKQSEDVAADAVTIAEALKKNGYATAHIGKYHVGGHKDKSTMPENVGFDINIGGYSQGHQPSCFATNKKGDWKFKGVGLGHFDRFGLPYSDAYVKRRNLPTDLVGTPKHISDAVGDALEETVGKLSDTGKPFYLQFHTYAVHGPVKARPDLKKTFQASGSKKSEYLGFIAGVDENLKRMLDLLDDPNNDGDVSDSIAENTIVFFTSDNGGTHADNLPLKGEKGMLTEGGIRVPLIVRWPGKIPAGTISDRKIHCLDYYPTCLQLAGNQWKPSREAHPLDGHSFADVLSNPDTAEKRDPVFYLFPGYMDSRAQPTVVAIDDLAGKRYKAFYYYEADSWELYCLTDDPGEAKNVIKGQPEVAAEMSKKIRAWLSQKHSTWKPKYPITKSSGKPAGPPPLF